MMGLSCVLCISGNVLPDPPMYSSSQSTLPHLYLYITPLFCQMVSLSLGLPRRPLMVLPPLKCICMPCLLQMFLQLSLKPLMYATTKWGLLVFLVVLFLVLLKLLLDLRLVWFKTQPAYLHLLLKPHCTSMTIITPLVIIYLSTTSALWEEKIIIWQDPSKKPSSSEWMTHPLKKYRKIPAATYMGWSTNEFTWA